MDSSTKRTKPVEHELYISFELISQVIEIMRRANEMLEWGGGGRGGVLQRAIAPTIFALTPLGMQNFRVFCSHFHPWLWIW
jgi:hypothetical protein